MKMSDDELDSNEISGDETPLEPTEAKLKNSSKINDFLRKDAKEYNEQIKNRGVVYIGRVPPFMKPNKAQSAFEQYGEVTRIFLQEEDPNVRKRRKANGGNGTAQFTEGERYVFCD